MDSDEQLEDAFVRFAMKERCELSDEFVAAVTILVAMWGDTPCVLCHGTMRAHTLHLLNNELNHRFLPGV